MFVAVVEKYIPRGHGSFRMKNILLCVKHRRIYIYLVDRFILLFVDPGRWYSWTERRIFLLPRLAQAVARVIGAKLFLFLDQQPEKKILFKKKKRNERYHIWLFVRFVEIDFNEKIILKTIQSNDFNVIFDLFGFFFFSISFDWETSLEHSFASVDRTDEQTL